MKIVCLGWGSLVWNAGSLLLKSKWFEDGPRLPIEFARQSQDGRLTLVIVENHTPIQTLWAFMDTDDIESAKISLQEREKILPKNLDKHIGVIKIDDITLNPISIIIKNWMISKEIDATIWTGLGPRFNKEERVPNSFEIVEYLKGLNNEKRLIAEDYIRNTPPQITTEYRKIIERELNWK